MGSPWILMILSARSRGMDGGRNLGRGFTESTMPNSTASVSSRPGQLFFWVILMSLLKRKKEKEINDRKVTKNSHAYLLSSRRTFVRVKNTRCFRDDPFHDFNFRFD